MKVMGVCISEENYKLGKIGSVSILPGAGCRHDSPCISHGCYAQKTATLYPSTRKSWTNNLNIAEEAPDLYFNAIRSYLEGRKPDAFRWHVAGDILNTYYMKRMLDIAKQFPDIKFLCFTKMYKLIGRTRRNRFPSNLRMVISAWPGHPIENPHGFPIAYMFDKKNYDDRIPEDAIKCKKQCDECMLCWDLPDGASVYFKKH